MTASIKGALAQLKTSYKAFTHNGKPMTKDEVESVLKYGLEQGYETTDEITDEEVDKILSKS